MGELALYFVPNDRKAVHGGDNFCYPHKQVDECKTAYTNQQTALYYA